MGVLSAVSGWIERRRQLRRLFQDNARQLIERDPAKTYYDAQRAAARARFSGDRQAFLHWGKGGGGDCKEPSSMSMTDPHDRIGIAALI
ncbi:hypothetical protein [Nitrobacter sp. Nb-311A]